MRVVAVVSRPVGASRASSAVVKGVSSVRRGPSANAGSPTQRRGHRRASSIAGSNDARRSRRAVFNRALRTGREETAAEDAARAREALRVQPEEENETDDASTGSWRVVSKTTVVDGVTAVGFKTRGRPYVHQSIQRSHSPHKETRRLQAKLKLSRSSHMSLSHKYMTPSRTGLMRLISTITMALSRQVSSLYPLKTNKRSFSINKLQLVNFGCLHR